MDKFRSEQWEPKIAPVFVEIQTLLPKQVHKTEKPNPGLAVALIVIVPSVMGWVAISAKYKLIAVLIAIFAPLIGLLSVFVTPLILATDDPDDGIPDITTFIPAPILVVYRMVTSVFSLFGGIKNQVLSFLGGMAYYIFIPVANWIKRTFGLTDLAYFAFFIQVGMGVCTMLTVPNGVFGAGTAAAGGLVLVAAVVQIPDAFAFLMENNPSIKALMDRFDRSKTKAEDSCTGAAEALIYNLSQMTAKVRARWQSHQMMKQLRTKLADNAGDLVELLTSWDTNGDGSLGKQELQKAVAALGFDSVPGEAVDHLFETFDNDGSGQIDFEELAAKLTEEKETEPEMSDEEKAKCWPTFQREVMPSVEKALKPHVREVSCAPHALALATSNRTCSHAVQTA